MCGNICEILPNREAHLSFFVFIILMGGLPTGMKHPCDWPQSLRLQASKHKQAFTINSIISINYLIKLVASGSRSQAHKYTLIGKNIQRSSPEERPYQGIGKIWATQFCRINPFLHILPSISWPKFSYSKVIKFFYGSIFSEAFTLHIQ